MADKSHSLYDFGPLASSYDKWYETPLGRASDAVQRAAVSRLLPAPQAEISWLLDVGCGTGHWSCFFAEKGYKVKGIDISPEMIEKARERNIPDCHFEVGDGCEASVDNYQYSVVTAITTLEFVSDQSAALKGMVKSTAPGGTVIIGVLNGLAPMNRERVESGEKPYVSGQLLAPSELYTLLAFYGEVNMIGAGKCNEEGGAIAESVAGIKKPRGSEVPDDYLDFPFMVAAVCLDE